MSAESESLVPQGFSAQLIRTYESLGDSFHGLRGTRMPSVPEVSQVLDALRDLLFPGVATGLRPKGAELRAHVDALAHDVALRLRRQLCFGQLYIKGHDAAACDPTECESCSDRITREFLAQLPAIRVALTRDAEAAMAGDPAASHVGEVVMSYPGFGAVTVYRIAHALWLLGAKIVPRMMTEYAHRTTGIDIHPGASIGESFFIDHGTGVVIGETTVIGDRVRLYQGVTLGALSLPSRRVRELRAGPKRHPTLEDDVIVYAGATILGGDTVIGKGAIIGGNCWVVESVPAGSRVTVQMQTDVRAPKGPNGVE
jgi:serine O-acetyltransferase